MDEFDRKKLAEGIRRSAVIMAACQTMMNNTNDMIFLKDAKLTYVAASMPFVKMVGKNSVDEIVNKTDLEIFADESLAKRYVADDHKLIEEGKNLENYIEPITDEGGMHRYGNTSKYILYGPDKKFLGILGITRDVTRDYIARQHYQQELKYLFEMPKDAYAVTYVDVDGWRIISQRRQLIEGCTFQSCFTVEELIKTVAMSVVDSSSEVAEFYRNFRPEVLREIYASGRSRLSFKYRRRMTTGENRWIYNEIRFLTDVDSGHLCAMLSSRDIDAEKRAEQSLMVAAKLDKMTMLLNRDTTMEQIRQILREEPEYTHALYMLDVDNFKVLNDTMGHQRGDEFLVALATEIRRHFRDTDVVGRIGGDEFFALMRRVPGKAEASEKAREILDAVQDICAEFSGILPSANFGEGPCASGWLSASIGICIYPDQAVSMDELYAKADAALYQAKRAGKNQFVFAEDEKSE